MMYAKYALCAEKNRDLSQEGANLFAGEGHFPTTFGQKKSLLTFFFNCQPTFPAAHEP